MAEDAAADPTNLTEVRENHTFDVGALGTYLAREIADVAPPLAVRQFAGGQSNPTFLLTDANGRRMVLRKKPPGTLLPSAHKIDREYRAMTALATVGFPVPACLHYASDETIIGTAFYVMDFLEGRIFHDVSLPDVAPAERGAIYDSLNATMAQMHEVDWQAAGLDGYGKPHGYVERQIGRWIKQWDLSKTHDIPAIDALIDWLPAHMPPEVPATIAHGDYRPANVMIHPTEPRVIAVLDWELATLGDPFADFAYHCMSYVLEPKAVGIRGLVGYDIAALGIPDLDSYRAAYCRRRNLTEVPHFQFYMAFSLFRLAVICQGIYHRYLNGIAADAAAAGYRETAQLLADVGWEQAGLA